MELVTAQQIADETQRVQSNRLELMTRIARAIPEDGRIEPLKGLYLNRISSPMGPVHSVSEPSFCVIAQGSKEIFSARSAISTTRRTICSRQLNYQSLATSATPPQSSRISVFVYNSTRPWSVRFWSRLNSLYPTVPAR